jgi:serine/threonine-protein kinase
LAAADNSPAQPGQRSSLTRESEGDAGAKLALVVSMDTRDLMTLPAEGELFDGKYEMGPVLGTGGMAAVFEARHMGLDDRVAIKLLLPACCDDPSVVERFVQEGKTATKIRSEHVVRMLDVGVASGRAYLVMEYLDGEDLESLLRKRGTLPCAEAIDLLLQACEAIGEAHALGIVHRDLKPANLFLTHRMDGSSCVKVLDFGISKMPRALPGARSTGSHPTLPTLVMGSPHYMSPEQMASSATTDARADIWSLGAILYELVTGRTAFEGTTPSEVCAHVLVGTPAPLAELRPDVPDGVALAISRCLERNLARRYSSVSELARALAPYGSPAALASSASIGRVAEGDLLATPPPSRPLCPSGAGTMKPTAAEILATGPAPRRGASGYLVAALLAVSGLALATGAIPLPSYRSAAAPAPAPATPSPIPVSSTAPAPAAGARYSASASPIEPRPAVHRARKHAPSALVLVPIAGEDSEAGPYDEVVADAG